MFGIRLHESSLAFDKVSEFRRPLRGHRHNFYYPDFFLVNILFGVAITSKKHKYKGGGVPFSFMAKRQHRENFRLQMIILREGTGASFKTNTLLAG